MECLKNIIAVKNAIYYYVLHMNVSYQQTIFHIKAPHQDFCDYNEAIFSSVVSQLLHNPE